MFKRENHLPGGAGDFNNVETIIGPSVKVEGDFVGHGNLMIEGVVKGTVKTDGSLTVGEKSQITASISAANAVVSGEIKGNIIVKGSLELTSTARIAGDITAKGLTIASGAIFNGKCEMSGGTERTITKTNGGKSNEESQNDNENDI